VRGLLTVEEFYSSEVKKEFARDDDPERSLMCFCEDVAKEQRKRSRFRKNTSRDLFRDKEDILAL